MSSGDVGPHRLLKVRWKGPGRAVGSVDSLRVVGSFMKKRIILNNEREKPDE